MHSKRLIRSMVKKLQGEDQGEHKLRETVRDISLETLWRCWRTYHCALLASLRSLKAMLVVPRHLRLSPKTLIKSGCRRVLMHDHFLCPCILILPMFRVIGSCIMTCIIHFVLLLPVYSMFLLQILFYTCFYWSYYTCSVLSVFKNSKTHKNWKIFKKFDCLCCVYHVWVWPSTFVLMV